MAVNGKKLTELQEHTTPGDNDRTYVVPDGGATSKNIKFSTLKTWLQTAFTTVFAAVTGTSSNSFAIGTGGPAIRNQNGVIQYTNNGTEWYPIGSGSEFEAPWDEEDIYSIGEIVTAGTPKKLYSSLTNSNIGNNPETSTANWELVNASEGSAIKAWAAGVYGSGLNVVLQGTEFYKLADATPRPFNSTNFATELTAGSWVILSNSGSGGGSSSWGAITGTLSAQTDLWAALNSKLSGTTSITYAQLRTAITNSTLKSGAYYKITDFTTKHAIPDTSVIHTGPVEPLIVQATGVNTISSVALSETYPNDIIYYDYTKDVCEDGDDTPRPGKIVERIDTEKRIRTVNDFRAVTYRRYKSIGLYHHASTKTSASLASATIIHGTVDSTPNRHREYLVEFSAFTTHNANPQLSLTKGANTVQREMVKSDGSAFAANELTTYLGAGNLAWLYYSPVKNKYVVSSNLSNNTMAQGYMLTTAVDYVIPSSEMAHLRLVVDANDYQDVLTFGSADPNISGVSIGARDSIGTYNNIVWLSTTNVANVEIEDGCYNIVYKNGNSLNNNIGKGCNNIFFFGNANHVELADRNANMVYVGDATTMKATKNSEGNVFFVKSGERAYTFSIGQVYETVFRLDPTGVSITGNHIENMEDSFVYWNGSSRNYIKSLWFAAWELGTNWNNVQNFEVNITTPQTFSTNLSNVILPVPAATPSNFKGVYTTLLSLQTANPSGSSGDYAFVDAGVGQNSQQYIWDSDDNAWIQSGSAAPPNATELTAGIAEIATQTEVNTGTDDARIVTAAKLAGWWTNIKAALQTFSGGIKTNFVRLPEIASPSAPPSDEAVLYVVDVNGITALEYKSSTGLTARVLRDTLFIVRNESGSTIAKGTPVYVANVFTGGEIVPIVAPAQSNSLTTMPCVGLAAQDIPNNGFGRVMSEGRIDGLNTSSYSVNNRLWVSSSAAGALTNTQPGHPNLDQRVAIVIRSHASQGSILVDAKTMLGELLGTIKNSFSIGDGLAGTKELKLQGSFSTTLTSAPTANRTISIPDASGDLVLTTNTNFVFNTPRTGQTFVPATGIQLDRAETYYNEYTVAGALTINLASGGVVGGTASIVFASDGVTTPVLGAGLNQWPNTDAYGAGAGKKNKLLVWKMEDKTYYMWKVLN